MALIDSCLCFSLLIGSFISSMICSLMYFGAFAFELWLLINHKVRLPLPAYMLCAIFLIMALLSALLIIGLIGKKTRILGSWLFMLTILYFIECGLILYMVINYWGIQHRFGLGELIFWVIRAIIDIFVFITILSQYATWRDEKQVMMRLHSLTSVVRLGADAAMRKDCAANARYSSMDVATAAYDNLAYTTASDLTLNNGTSSTPMSNGRLKRSISSASQVRLHRAPSLYGGSLPSNGYQLHEIGHVDSVGGFRTDASEFDASTFSEIFPFAVRSQSELSLSGSGSGSGGGAKKPSVNPHHGHSQLANHHHHCRHGRQKPRSVMYLDEDDYLARPPPSRPVSMGYVNAVVNATGVPVDMSTIGGDGVAVSKGGYTQSLDRSKLGRKGLSRRATSVDALNGRILADIKLQKMDMRPFEFLQRPGSKPCDLDIEAEENRNIRDIAL